MIRRDKEPTYVVVPHHQQGFASFLTLVDCIHMLRVGQNCIYTVYTRCSWREYHQIYGHNVCIYDSGRPYICTIPAPTRLMMLHCL